MKKIIVYTGMALAIGLLSGYFLFKGDATHEHQQAEESGTTMYTCSMHPQIMQPEPGDCPICGMDLIPAEAGADGLAANQFKMSDHAMALANIETTQVGAQTEDSNRLVLSGTIEANEKTSTIQSAYFKGRIEKLYVSASGETVNQGQLLATLYAPELITAQQELLTTMAMKSEQPELYQAVRKKLKLWKLSDQQINAIESRGTVTEYFPVYATISGTVTEKLVKEGDYINAGQPLFKVANLNSVWAVLDAWEKQIPMLEKGQEVTITTNAYPGTAFNGVIDLVDPIMNTSSRSIDVRVELTNRDQRLKPGMFIKGEIATNDTSSEVTVPKSAVMWTGKRSVVYVQPDPNLPVFELREVDLGQEQGDVYALLGGLEDGEYVVSNGTFTVDAAAQLQDKPSMMNREQKTEALQMQDITLPSKFQKEFWPLIDGYIRMNDAFVASAPDLVQEQAGALLKQYETLDRSALGETEGTAVKKTGQMIAAIARSSDIEDQRTHLVILSDLMVTLASRMEDLPETLYVQNCPMANQNKGADWLSKQEHILNPYYGDMMLTCGSVTDTLNKAQQ
ncbi:efflux RND transporter periplasmic adaptor subunit [Robertkochia sediminum]|uniref:efflux RND transporter periplasmic adaptor subunit n=1 Tax=Robertkochia sediminum TaxID=2785326 RepID=UPI001934A269|nr:efflux RND transporter periplasmic adaptor subunit [Robertkochia sediminum]MBL7471505.1 efflux RND transporter periplasmic adaptor subunit [Robertkochia sediminum]